MICDLLGANGDDSCDAALFRLGIITLLQGLCVISDPLDAIRNVRKDEIGKHALFVEATLGILVYLGVSNASVSSSVGSDSSSSLGSVSTCLSSLAE